MGRKLLEDGGAEDQRGRPFGLIDIICIPGCTRQGVKRTPFCEPFMSKFISIKSLDMRELHVWLWIVEHEKMATVTDLYKAYIKFEYNIFHGTYVPCKTEGICASTRPMVSSRGGGHQPNILNVQ